MKQLWILICRFCPKDSQTGTFLTINILLWTAAAFLLGIFFCMAVVQLTLTSCLAPIMCAAIYAGIIFGLFGGILYLMRNSH